MGWKAARDAVLDEADGLVQATLDLSPEAWAAPTRCQGWTVGDVTSHVAAVMAVQQLAFQHMLAGDTTTPGFVERPHVSHDDTSAALHAVWTTAIDTMGRLRDAHAEAPVPLPVATFPCHVALDVLVLEYGTHRWDITSAADHTVTLSPSAAATTLRLLPAFLSFFAAPPPAEPMSYVLESANSAPIHISSGESGWALEPAGPAVRASRVTTVRADDGLLALYALGRIGADDPRLDISGPAAGELKTWFPGP